MKIIFLGGLYTDSVFEYVRNNSIGPLQNAANILQKNYLHGFINARKGIELICINLPFIGSYPKHFKDKNFIPSRNIESIYDSWTVYNLKFNNIKGFKNIARAFNAIKTFFSMIRSEEKCSIVCYSMHLPFLCACYLAKVFKAGCKFYVIIPDLPEYMSERKGIGKKIHEWINRLSYFIVNRSDGAVYITEHMASRFSHSLPYTVIEGIALPDVNIDNDWWQDEIANKQYFLYTGTLDRRYGIKDLIDSYIESGVSNLKLVICGDGNEREYVKKMTLRYNNIVYLGQLEHYKIMKLQINASLLINPRSNEGEYTKFSFPSKVIEYMRSGVPTLMYKLGGIPNEYDEFFFHINSTGEFSSKLKEIAAMDSVALGLMGEAAKKFIMKNCNSRRQVDKLISLIERT
ncbi:glycosyltransferase [Aeromonas popoffii]|uniref:glycosyltransferase n=1 Tax=Aeromonas popoffii TaxID=70856 RepID=UPI000A7D9278|nr:glycosyltransferase [Aeromonas popoffii]